MNILFRRCASRLICSASLFSVAVFSLSVALAQIPAFPGAEGFGAYATGGRGGDVYHVTNLSGDSTTPGSLPYGLANAPAAGRTIVFDVSGYIRISGTMTLSKSKITIAGQTAPGDGIGVTNGTFLIRGKDVIVRHFRFRDGYSADSLNLDVNSTNCIIDHCDVMLSNDENLSTYNSRPDKFTFQWSINAWGMETHSAGGLWDMVHATAHHTLWSHNHTRNPKARPDGLLDWVNNVTFDWDIGYIMGDSETPANWKSNVRGCYFICPPGNLRSVALQSARLDRNGNPNFTLYLDDSWMDNNGDGILNVSKTGYSLASGSYATSSTPFATTGIPVTRDDPLTAYKKIVSAVGPLRMQVDPTKPLRDEIDTILIDNLVNQRPHHVSSPGGTGAANGGFGFLNSTTPPADTDQDGMPDYWETAIGSNPNGQNHNDPVPAGAYIPHQPAGYTLLEEYLHFLTIPHAVIPMNGSVDVDLRKFTSGFNKAPVTFTVSNVTNGTATLQADGYTVRFVPSTDFVGRGRFDFRVTDGDGSTWTQTCGVLASGSLTAPAAPSGLAASAASSSQVDLSWIDNANNETGFRIERSGDGVNFTEITTVDANVTGFSEIVAPATTYYYRVRAYNGVANSDYSNISSVTTPTGPPAVPTSLNAKAGNARVTLTWNASPGATSYRVKRGEASGGPYTVVGSPATAGYTDTTVANGTTYYYVVSAVNGYGESGNSAQASATPSSAITYPAEDAFFGGGSVFEDKNAGFNGTGYINFSTTGGFLQFDNVDAGAGGSVTLRFRNALGVTSSRTGVLLVNGVSQSITFDPTGAWTTWVNKDVVVTLEPGIENTIRLESNGQDLANIDELTVINAGSGPAAPTGLSATAGNAVVNLSWTQSASPGITQNKVYRSTSGSGGPYNLLATLSATTSHADSSVVNGSTYYYVVTALNADGESDFSNYAGATPQAPPPNAPGGLSASAVSSSQINLSWTDNANNEDGFKIERSTDGVNFTQIATVGANTTSYASTGLAASTTYYYRVRAYNGGGDSGYSNTASATTQAPSATSPAFVAAGAVAAGTAEITPGLPSGIASGDILLLFVETANQAISISNPNGGTWAEVTGSPQGTGTAGGSSATRLTVFWSRYNGSQGAPTLSDSGNHQLARMIAIRGAVASGNPWDVTVGGIESTSDTSGSIPGTTTTVNNTLVVLAVAAGTPDSNGTSNFSGWSNANLSNLTERTDNTSSAGNGGGLGLATGEKATAGAYGNTTVTHANSAVKAMISIAIK